MKDDKYTMCAYGLTLFIDFLTVIFVLLKVRGDIDWSWLWVFAPLWIGFLGFLIFAIIIIFLNDN